MPRLLALLCVCASVTAWQPTAPRLHGLPRARVAACAESPKQASDVALDEEMVAAAVAAAASSKDAVLTERIDAALAELARGGNQDSAAAAGGFSRRPSEEPLPEVAVPGWLSIAPPAIGAISILLFVLNLYGVFGEGPDLDALANEWSS